MQCLEADVVEFTILERERERERATFSSIKKGETRRLV